MLLIQIALVGFASYNNPSAFWMAAPASHSDLKFESFCPICILFSGRALSAAHRSAVAITTTLPDGSAAEQRGEGVRGHPLRLIVASDAATAQPYKPTLSRVKNPLLDVPAWPPLFAPLLSTSVRPPVRPSVGCCPACCVDLWWVKNICRREVCLRDRRHRGCEHRDCAVDRKRSRVLPTLFDPDGDPQVRAVVLMMTPNGIGGGIHGGRW